MTTPHSPITDEATTNMKPDVPNQMQLLLIGLWAIKGKAPTRDEMIEFYHALIAAGNK